MNDIFVSYRRSDSSAVVGRVIDRLEDKFGEECIFRDLDSIGYGQNFGEVINQALTTCKVCLVIIGNDWVNICDDTGKRRLDNGEDWVRVEVSKALELGVHVIPVLVENAMMPAESQLPNNLKLLVTRNAAKVRDDPDFNVDMERLCIAIKKNLSYTPSKTRKLFPKLRILFALAVLLFFLVLMNVSNFNFSDDLTVMVDLYEEPQVNSNTLTTHQYQVNYSSLKKDGYLDISYSTDYFQSEAKLVGFLGEGPFFNLPKVGIDIKFANNTDKSIIISKVNVEVISSEKNNQPLMVLPDDPSSVGEIKFKNEGWGVPKEIQVLARVRNGKSAEYVELPYTTHGGSYVFDVSPILAMYGIQMNEVKESIDHERLTDFANIKKNILVKEAHSLCIKNFHPESLDKYLYQNINESDGPFMDFPFNCTVNIEGSLQFSWNDEGNKKNRLNFSTDVLVSPSEGLGDLGFDPTGSYEINLKPEGHNYIVTKPIFHTLKSGEFDRIVLLLGTSQSSNHDFKVTVEYNNNEIASSSRVRLNYLMPKDNAYFLESVK